MRLKITIKEGFPRNCKLFSLSLISQIPADEDGDF